MRPRAITNRPYDGAVLRAIANRPYETAVVRYAGDCKSTVWGRFARCGLAAWIWFLYDTQLLRGGAIGLIGLPLCECFLSMQQDRYA